MNLEYQKITDNYPYDMLLLADETREAIDQYLHKSDVYVVKSEQQTIAVFCLYPNSPTEIELKNIAVARDYQNRGLGSEIITKIFGIVKDQYNTIIVGTGEHSYQQINFYEKNGFERFGIRDHFFINNYPEPIYENGKLLKDMVLLKMDF